MLYTEGTKKFNSCVDFILNDASREELKILKHILVFQLEIRMLDLARYSKEQTKLKGV